MLSSIPPECRLAMAFRVLARASYLDCMLAFGMGRSTVFEVFQRMYAPTISGVCSGQGGGGWAGGGDGGGGGWVERGLRGVMGVCDGCLR